LEAMKPLVSLIRANTVIGLLQNGMGIQDDLKAALFPDRPPFFVLFSIQQGSNLTRSRPNLELFWSVHGSVIMATPENAAEEPPVKAMIEMMCGLAELNPSVAAWADFRRILELKLLDNTTLNPLAVLLNVNNPVMSRCSYTRELIASIVEEDCLVLDGVRKQAGLEGSLGDPAQLTEKFLAKVASFPEENTSSTGQDVRRGASSTEVDFLNGYIVKMGKALGIPTPANSMLLALVHARVALRHDQLR